MLYRISYFSTEAATDEETIALHILGEVICDRVIYSKEPLEFGEIKFIAESQPGYMNWSSWDDVTGIYNNDRSKINPIKLIECTKNENLYH